MQREYLPEVDGLRAIAVILAILYHLSHIDLLFSILPGGYVGVDVFFVISGFLILPLVWREMEAGVFSVRGFFARRIRRLLPVALVVTTATVVAGVMLLDGHAARAMCEGVLWQMALLANYYFYGQSGYFEANVLTKPLIHTWSLAVEEQFYLLAPFIIMGCFRLSKSRAWLIGVLGLVGATSFAWNIRCFSHGPGDDAYYLLPSRAWEMALGGIAALIPALKLPKRISTMTGAMCLGVILYSAVTFTAETMFPYWNALIPVGATAVLLWIGMSDVVKQVLSQRYLVHAGKVSYSLYLWHWPAICFAPLVLPRDYAAFGALGITVVLSFASFAGVESTLRRRGDVRYILGGVVTVCALAAGGLRWVPSASARGGTDTFVAGGEWDIRVPQIRLSAIQSGNIPEIGDSNGDLGAVVWGDSHAMALVPAVDQWLKQNRKRGVIIAHGFAPPVVNLSPERQYSLREQHREWAIAAIGFIRRENPPVVILGGYWDEHSGREVSKSVEQILEGGRTTEVLVVKDVPCFYGYEQHGRKDLGDANPARQPDAIAVAGAGGRILDPRDSFLSDDGQSYVMKKNGRLLYWDGAHLSSDGSIAAIYPLLKDIPLQ